MREDGHKLYSYPQASLDNLVSSGKLAQKEFAGKSVYWLVSEFSCTAKETPRATTATPRVRKITFTIIVY